MRSNATSRTSVVVARSATVALTLGLAACSSGGSSTAATSTPTSAPTTQPGTAPGASAPTTPTASPTVAPGTTAPASSATSQTASSTPGTPPATTGSDGTPSATVVGANADSRNFDPAAFTWPLTGANQWMPLIPGYQSVREGTLDRGTRELTHRRVYTVTDVTKEVDGVRAILVLDQDFDAGEIAEQAVDYFAQDREGNVWYVGSYTEGYQGGQFVNARDAWLAGVGGAEPGVMMLSDPTTDAGSYRQSVVPGEGELTAEISAVGVSQCVPYQCFDDVLATLEDGTEFKYYARGVGGILTEPNYSGGEQETEQLVGITELTPEGLTELSTVALAMDEHARSTAPGVFGTSAKAERTG